jgi:hypothetical protein
VDPDEAYTAAQATKIAHVLEWCKLRVESGHETRPPPKAAAANNWQGLSPCAVARWRRSKVRSSREAKEVMHFRPRLRFSLRTLFVLVTTLAVGLGWLNREWQLVQERKAMIDGREIIPKRTEGRFHGFPREKLAIDFSEDAKYLTFLRRWMGDSDYSSVRIVNEFTETERRRIERVFPRAKISIVRLVGTRPLPLPRPLPKPDRPAG